MHNASPTSLETNKLNAGDNPGPEQSSLPAADCDLSGATLTERYRIIEQIGEGALSKVYKAEHNILHEFVAIKILKQHLLSGTSAQARFKREAQLAVRLHHPNVVRIIGYGVSNEDEPFIVMEFCDGINLEQALSDGALSLEKTVSIGKGLADALSHAHDLGIIHRDIKPGNIVIPKGELTSSTPKVKLLDFGLAKDLAGAANTTGGESLTNTTFMLGTPNYMSPEQCRSKAADHRSDIYALGCVLYECATGRKPYLADSDLAVMNMHLHDQAKFENSDKVTDNLKSIILKCLQKDPEQRFQSANKVLEELHNLPLAGEAKEHRFKIKAFLLLSILIACIAGTVWKMLSSRTQVTIPKPAQTRVNSNDRVVMHRRKNKAKDLWAESFAARKRHDHLKAASLMKEAARLNKSTGEKVAEIDCLFEVGATYLMMPDQNDYDPKLISKKDCYENARAALQESVDLANATNFSIIKPLLLRHLAFALRTQNRYEESIQNYKLAFNLGKKLDQRRDMFFAQAELIDELHSRLQYKDVIAESKSFRTAFPEFPVDNLMRYEQAQLNLLDSLLRCNQFKEAKAETDRLVALVATLEHNEFNVKAFLQVANYAFHSKQYPIAKKMARCMLDFTFENKQLPAELPLARKLLQDANAKLGS